MRHLFLCLAAGFIGLSSAHRADAQSGVDPIIGTIGVFAFNYCPRGWITADGSELQISKHITLFGLIGTRYGGDGESTFAVPDLRGTAIAGAQSATIPAGEPGAVGSVISVNQGEATEPTLKALQMTTCIASVGILPAR